MTVLNLFIYFLIFLEPNWYVIELKSTPSRIIFDIRGSDVHGVYIDFIFQGDNFITSFGISNIYNLVRDLLFSFDHEFVGSNCTDL